MTWEMLSFQEQQFMILNVKEVERCGAINHLTPMCYAEDDKNMENQNKGLTGGL